MNEKGYWKPFDLSYDLKYCYFRAQVADDMITCSNFFLFIITSVLKHLSYKKFETDDSKVMV
jgi:hypothetical protein